ncbi:MAG: chemotaxis protein CheX [Clostridiales bacterium]|nr:chemotaxis protein CheX [Clostridiales bacterium]
MRVEYINPFIKASTEVLKMIAQIDFTTGKPYMKSSPFTPSSVLIVVGITGAIQGQAVISMSKELAMGVASKMMMGMPVNELDEMSKSALSELGNMIMGNAATLLYNEKVHVDITPPTLMVGDGITISSSTMTTIGVPLNSELGTMNFDISIKER